MSPQLPFLSEAWLDEVAGRMVGLPVGEFRDGSVRFVIAATPHGKVQFQVVVTDGRVADFLVGASGWADVTMTCRYPDAVEHFTGELGLEVAYMVGRSKLEGDYTRVLFGMRGLLEDSAWEGFLRDLRGLTVVQSSES